MVKMTSNSKIVNQYLDDLSIKSRFDSYRKGYEDGGSAGYRDGQFDEITDIMNHGVIIRFPDSHIYTWDPVIGEWEHTPDRWDDVLNEIGLKDDSQ